MPVPLPQSPPNSPAVPDSTQASAYKDYAVDTAYTYDSGLLILPVASATPKVVVCRVHGGYGTRTVSFGGIKRDTPPILPVAQDVIDPALPASPPGANVTDTLVGASIDIKAPVPNPLSTGYDWSVGGEYVYVTTRPLSRGGPRIPGRSVLYAGRMPYPITPQDQIAAAIGVSTSGASSDDYYINSSPTVATIQAGQYVWPFTVLTPNFFDPTQIVG